MQLKISHLFNSFQHDTDNHLLQPYGDDINADKPTHVTRFAFQNINGIDRDPEPAAEVIETLKEYDIDVFGTAETNCDWTPEFTHKVSAILEKTFGNSQITTSSAKYPNKHGYLPGGVSQIARGSILGRFPTNGSDSMGRYTWQCFSGANTRILCVITAYRVSQDKYFSSSHKHDSTAHRQQLLALLQRGIKDPDPRAQMLTDLQAFIEKKQRDGFEIILMIDANDAPTQKSQFYDFTRELGLTDIHDHQRAAQDASITSSQQKES